MNVVLIPKAPKFKGEVISPERVGKRRINQNFGDIFICDMNPIGHGRSVPPQHSKGHREEGVPPLPRGSGKVG